MVWLSLGWLGLVLFAVLFAFLLPLHGAGAIVGDPRMGPFQDWSDPLGRDWLGRSQLSRLVNGARTSITVAGSAAVVGLVVGGVLGALSGYVRGKTEGLLNILADALVSLPPLFVLLAITAVLEQDQKTLVLGLAIISVPAFYRLSRASTMSLASRDFVTAAQAMGASPARIMFKELIPNVVIPLLSYSFLIFAILVVAEGSLSFLGLGIKPPAPSWGGQLAGGRQFLSTDPHLVLVPGALFVLTVLSLNIVGDAVRRRFDVKESALR
ncbi:hypothetical protein GCM10009788_20130 [Nocardioides humi]|uniref:ABC transmembrane type-1 domain-containing protein n=2 Tax=Nocardioides humi TaxID=449461 RepID=A0ABN2AEH9_9ACTN